MASKAGPSKGQNIWPLTLGPSRSQINLAIWLIRLGPSKEKNLVCKAGPRHGSKHLAWKAGPLQGSKHLAYSKSKVHHSSLSDKMNLTRGVRFIPPHQQIV